MLAGQKLPQLNIRINWEAGHITAVKIWFTLEQSASQARLMEIYGSTSLKSYTSPSIISTKSHESWNVRHKFTLEQSMPVLDLCLQPAYGLFSVTRTQKNKILCLPYSKKRCLASVIGSKRTQFSGKASAVSLSFSASAAIPCLVYIWTHCPPMKHKH